MMTSLKATMIVSILLADIDMYICFYDWFYLTFSVCLVGPLYCTEWPDKPDCLGCNLNLDDSLNITNDSKYVIKILFVVSKK